MTAKHGHKGESDVKERVDKHCQETMISPRRLALLDVVVAFIDQGHGERCS